MARLISGIWHTACLTSAHPLNHIRWSIRKRVSFVYQIRLMIYLLTLLNNNWPNSVIAKKEISVSSVFTSSILYSSVICLMYAKGYSYRLMCRDTQWHDTRRGTNGGPAATTSVDLWSHWIMINIGTRWKTLQVGPQIWDQVLVRKIYVPSYVTVSVQRSTISSITTSRVSLALRHYSDIGMN